MTRLTIAIEDRLAEAVKVAAGDNVSAWMARLARREIVRLAVDSELAHDRRDPGWRERAEEHTRELDTAS